MLFAEVAGRRQGRGQDEEERPVSVAQHTALHSKVGADMQQEDGYSTCALVGEVKMIVDKNWADAGIGVVAARMSHNLGMVQAKDDAQSWA